MNQKVLGFVVVSLSAFLVASILAAEIQQKMPSVDGPVISVKIQLILRDTLLARWLQFLRFKATPNTE